MYAPRARTGAVEWALGLIGALCFPFIPQLIGPVVQFLVGYSHRTEPGVGGQNARAAANWAVTFLLAFVLFAGTHIVMLFAIPDGSEIKQSFFPFGIPITIAGLLYLVNIGVCVTGLVKASNGKAFRAPALPVLRDPA